MRILGLDGMRGRDGACMADVSTIHSLLHGYHSSSLNLFSKSRIRAALVRQNKLILASKNLRIVSARSSPPQHCSSLAEQNTNGGILGRQFHLAIIVVHIHICIGSQVLMVQRHLEIDEDKTLEQAIENTRSTKKCCSSKVSRLCRPTKV